MKKLLHISQLAAVVFALAACQHGIDPDDLPLPEESDMKGIEISGSDPAEVEKELKQIQNTPYPAYTIQGGDTFRIRVYNEEDLNTDAASTTMVTPDGFLIMSLIKPTNIKDLTILQATDKICHELSKFVKNPQISLMPEKIQGKTATLYGAVRDPGNYQVNENTRLIDFIAMGKGYQMGVLDDNTTLFSDISKSYIIRNDKILPVNFIEAVERGNQLHNIKIFPNDIVYIARKEDSRVIIMGEVKRPRAMNWHYQMTVLEAIAMSGGLAEDYWGTVLVIRQAKEAGNGGVNVYKIDLDDLIAGRSRNYYLASGDIVYIPKDSLGEYNVFVRKLMPTAQLINLLMSPPAYWFGPGK